MFIKIGLLKTSVDSSISILIKFHIITPIEIHGIVSLRGILNNDTKTNERPAIKVIVLRVIHKGPKIDLVYLRLISNQDNMH